MWSAPIAMLSSRELFDTHPAKSRTPKLPVVGPSQGATLLPLPPESRQ